MSTAYRDLPSTTASTSAPSFVDNVRATTRARTRRLLSGPTGAARWERPALLGLLAATALLYLWGLGASGWANAFYSAAAQAGSVSWKAFFFGSFDAGNAITVDKPPAALWVMAISARIFGVNSWSILVPEALMGVATVGFLHATVRRHFGAAAGLLAGAVMALTPVSVLMFRFNNPDALLVLLLVMAAWALTRALETASTRWLTLVGILVGFGFLTKMLQALLVVPGFALVYLLAAPTGLGRRIRQLLLAGAALVASAGWWLAIVELWPAGSRPFIGGSQTNSILELVLGYNGLGRLTGNETGSVVGGGGQGQPGQWGATGVTRLFSSEMGGQVAWLLPAALVFAGVLLWLSRRAPRTEPRRAQVLTWTTWLVVTGLTFSLAQGIIHPYYTVALAPAIGALVGLGAVTMWQRRTHLVPRLTLAVAMAATTATSFVLLARSPQWLPWLRWAVLVLGAVATLALAVRPHLPPRLSRRLAIGTASAALLASLLGPAAYAVDTARTPHTGSLPTAGPAVAGGFGPAGFGPGRGGMPGGGFRGGLPGLPQGQAGQGQAGGFQRGQQGGLGGLLDTATPSSALVQLLQQNASSYRWAAAAVGSNSAAGVQLATGLPVMAIGGFNGTDPSPTLAQFQQWVSQGKIHYFLASGQGMRGGFGGGGFGGGGFGPGGSDGRGTSTSITSWVESHYTATTVGGVIVYDLTTPPSTTGTTA